MEGERVIDKDALEEGPLGDVIRDLANDLALRGIRQSTDLQQIADEADRREREWRRLYASMKKQRDALERRLTGKQLVHFDPPRRESPVEFMRRMGERAWRA